jgi:hypothetical protein
MAITNPRIYIRTMPNWVVVAFIVILLAAGIGLTAKRLRVERRLARTVWKVLTGR